MIMCFLWLLGTWNLRLNVYVRYSCVFKANCVIITLHEYKENSRLTRKTLFRKYTHMNLYAWIIKWNFFNFDEIMYSSNSK